MDLAFFKSSCKLSTDPGVKSWSWRIRLGAIQTLIRICQCLPKESSKEGLLTVAWSILFQANETERDPRVTEALRVGYVYSNMETAMTTKLCSPHSLTAHLADSLVQIYLATPQEIQKQQPEEAQRAKLEKSEHENVPSTNKRRTHQKPRISLREEILLRATWSDPPLDYNTRTTTGLRELIESQWNKNVLNKILRDLDAEEE